MQQQEDSHNISVTWRGKKLTLEINSGGTLMELGLKLQKMTDVKPDTMRFITPSNRSSRLLSPFSDEHSCLTLQETAIFEGTSVRMMGATKDEVDEILENAKANTRIAGFDEEEKRMKQRMVHGPRASLKLPQGPYIFCDFRALYLAGIELNPPASEALKLMHMLATDPGIVAIMNKHRWRVGIMTEMAPEGYVGVSPECILGFNKNHGEEISLRLRTDDLKGFRKYDRIKQTLLHELAHMVYSAHDENFHALDKQLNQEAATLDWTKSRGHTLTGIRRSEQYEEDFYVDNSNRPHKLGGQASDQLASARASSVAAAYRRFADASSNMLTESDVSEEPEADASGLFINANISKDQWERKEEPDPDDCNNSQHKFDPDSNGSRDAEAMESGPYAQSSEGRITPEPDPDDSGMTQFMPPKAYQEPDPDDMEISLLDGVVKPNRSMEIMESLNQLKKILDEPDPDCSGAIQSSRKHGDNELRPDQNNFAAIKTLGNQDPCSRDSKEPDPDDIMVTHQGISVMQKDEPDPDDPELQIIQDPVTAVCGRLQKAIEMLQSEVNPSELVTVLQTLFKIIRNVIDHPDDMKFKKLRKANPVIQRNVANYKAAMDILSLVGFIEDVVSNEIGRAESYLILKRNDPGLLWLAKSSLETCIAY